MSKIKLAPRFYLREDWQPHEDTVFQLICNLVIHKDVVMAQIPPFIRANSACHLRPRSKKEWEKRFTQYVSRKWACDELVEVDRSSETVEKKQRKPNK